MANTATEATATFNGTLVGEIQISGLKCFKGWNWREAIIFYLNGMDCERRDVIYCPKIHFSVDLVDGGADGFGGCTLQFDPEREKYLIQESNLNGARSCPFGASMSIFVSLSDYRHVEHGLRRFVRSNQIESLLLQDCTRTIRLWKTPGIRSGLHIGIRGE